MRLRVVLALVFVPAVACLIPDVASLTGGGEADASVDVALDSPRASGDSGTADARFCTLAPQPNLICDDFDDDTPLSDWTSTTKTFAELVTTQDTFVSAPFGLRTRHGRRDGGPDGYVSLELIVPTPARGFRASFSARINVDIPKVALYQEVFQFWPISRNGGCWVSSDFVDFQPEDAASATSKAFVTSLAIGKWQAWVVTFTRPPDAGPGSVEVRIDGVTAANLPLSSTNLGPTLRIVLGPEHLRAEDEWSAEYDNVLITAL